MKCMVCYEEDKDNSVNLSCGHEYCVDCFVKHMSVDNRCGMCRGILHENKKKLNVESVIGKISKTIEDLYADVTNDKHIELCNFAVTLIDNINDN